MKKLISFLFLFVSISAFAKIPLQTASYVDVERYIGKWYVISSLPQFFTRNCKGQTADYQVINQKTISVLNTCLKAKGKSTIRGKAVVVNPQTNAELVVTFNNFFTRLFRVRGDYNVIKIDADYQYVLVGSEDRKSLWIMSRTTEMPEEIYDEYVEEARVQQFPIERLEFSRY